MNQFFLDLFSALIPDTTVRQKFYNNLSARLTTSIDGATTVLHYDSVSGNWPSLLSTGEWFHLTLSSVSNDKFEVVKVTGITPMTLTVVRAQEGTTPQLWHAPTTVLSGRLTAETLQRHARRDEVGSWTQPQEFEQGVFVREDARARDEFSLGGAEVPNARWRLWAGNAELTATRPMNIDAPGLRFNGVGWPTDPNLIAGQYLFIEPIGLQVIGKPLEWYLGAYVTPPAVIGGGDPLQPGMVYFDLNGLRPKVWTGLVWRDMFTPGPGWTLQLVYEVTATQDVFPLGTLDVNGNSFAFDLAEPEEVQVFLNGVMLVPDIGAYGDYSINTTTSTITLYAAAPPGSTLQVNTFISPAKLATGTKFAVLLEEFATNGSTTTFPLNRLDNGDPVSVAVPEDLEIYFDGVRQRPTVDYTVSGTNVTFLTAPAAPVEGWAVYLETAEVEVSLDMGYA